jgi:hypothetical protein
LIAGIKKLLGDKAYDSGLRGASGRLFHARGSNGSKNRQIEQ